MGIRAEEGTVVLTHHVAALCAADAVGCPATAQPGGTGETLPAAEPVGSVGGLPAPAPAAADDRFVALDPGQDAMKQFVTDYLQLLDGRLDAIRRCLADSDMEGARVAILSLESSSLMLGKNPLTASLAELRSQLDLSSAMQRHALMSSVEHAATSFRADLERAAQ
ncbi:hypothetical protein MLP_34940 [Microlunatus phosphovorus NM-1]|uniref:HPt domain-containing protein n=1 Tax=Microlunatus phosphovorus (strain ATCC 700054 / DSM 10555 / JCM 9379 / NBRC 101784 / NCIMB 13414 / VKM Ac-1990 / NM-1) TaxID=1032480 RepID=F5XN58_MICPN|nr:hypothetical protein MLP_34940 [Microlunatus phosphovorus NM-1]